MRLQKWNKARWRGGDKLQLNVEDAIRSMNGAVILTLQRDGNLVLYDVRGGQKRPLWASNTDGRQVTHAVLQHDGNFVVYNGKQSVWWTGTNKHVGADLALQDDGNLVVYDWPNSPIWASDTYGFKDARGGHGFGAWVGNAVKSAGRAVSSATGAVADVASSVGDAVKKVPLVGPAFHASFDLAIGSQLSAINAMASGERIDRVAMDHLKRNVGDIREAAPYIQTIISVVPGIGPGISGAIGAGLALAQGKRIDEAILEGVKSALPGGALAKAAFDAGVAVASGKPVEQVALAALPIDDSAKKAIGVGLVIARKLASGERVDKVAVDQALAALPPDVRVAAEAAVKTAKGQNPIDVIANVALEKGVSAIPTGVRKDVEKAVQTGVTLGAAKTIQDTAAKAATGLQGPLAKLGDQFARANPVAKAAQDLAGPASKKGFDIGLAVMQHQITPLDFHAIRRSLSPEQKKGFDMAVSHHIGRVSSSAPKGNAHAQAAFLMAHGMRGANVAQSKAMLKTAMKHPEGARGVRTALRTVDAPHKSWWARLLETLGLA